MKIFILIIGILVFACSGLPPVGAQATPEQASLVILKATLNNDFDGLEYYPVCGGVAVASDSIITAAHCVETQTVPIVDYQQWFTTGSAKSVGKLVATSGNLATLRPESPLQNWSRVAIAVDGPALLVRRFESATVVLSGARLSGQLAHGDSGSGLFQAGALVGVVESCDAPTPDNGTECLATGGTFTRVIP